jgi:6-phosphofructokinase
MQSHERCSVVEVMGRNAGFLAMYVGLAVGATAILVPEKQIDFEIAKHETKSINAYAGNDNDFEYYLKHDAEIDRLALVADEEAIKFINNYRESKTILELLPIVVAKEYGAKSSTLSRGDTCERSYCLKITDDNADLRKEMEAKIVELGYDPENYEIIYERTDSIEEDNED